MLYTFVCFDSSFKDETQYNTAVAAVEAAFDHWSGLSLQEKKDMTSEGNYIKVFSGDEKDPYHTCILDFKDVLFWEGKYGWGDQHDRCVKNALWRAEMCGGSE